MASHDKKNLVMDAIESVIHQSHPDWQLIVLDSGKLFDSGFFDSVRDDRIQIIHSTETAELRKTTNMASWCYNQILSSQNCDGQLVTYLCDDDYYYDSAFSVFNEFFTNNQTVQAAYASIDLSVIDQEEVLYGERKALEICGDGTYRMDCRVDYLQFCHRAEILNLLPSGRWWSERKQDQAHADGLFMESIAAKTLVYPIPKKVGRNRRAKNSVNFPC